MEYLAPELFNYTNRATGCGASLKRPWKLWCVQAEYSVSGPMTVPGICREDLVMVFLCICMYTYVIDMCKDASKKQVVRGPTMGLFHRRTEVELEPVNDSP